MKVLSRAILVSLAVMALAQAAWADPAARQQEVAQKGAMVMPFNGQNSKHVFQKLPDGGLQQVIADDASDKDLVGAIQMHLSMEADRFQKGDYSDPMMIHGMDMPGVQYLSSVKPGQIVIVYRDLPNGAEVRYTGKDAATVAAIHKWFDAQLSDHGSDATDKPPGR
ncbi:MAG TPA: aspartate carbamoyltransferase [Gammaproteobacteria bacterium]|nr:aspartate carbamoyltransferase [Gammaproteobacteria bacterium]